VGNILSHQCVNSDINRAKSFRNVRLPDLTLAVRNWCVPVCAG
jgi:hypothetical protein